jgi:hypothetical protein
MLRRKPSHRPVPLVSLTWSFWRGLVKPLTSVMHTQRILLRAFGAIFGLRGVFYVLQAFIAYNSLYGSLAENVFYIIFFASLALIFTIISYAVLSGLRRSTRPVFSTGLAMLILDPAFIRLSHSPIDQLIWACGVAALSALVFCWLRLRSWPTPHSA